jgi:hypothetical protein
VGIRSGLALERFLVIKRKKKINPPTFSTLSDAILAPEYMDLWWIIVEYNVPFPFHRNVWTCSFLMDGWILFLSS